MDLLAENIIKENIESGSYSWVEGQRNLVIEAMQTYHKTLADESYRQLNSDISKLKNYILRYKPSINNYKKTKADHERYKKDFEEWDELMRL